MSPVGLIAVFQLPKKETDGDGFVFFFDKMVMVLLVNN